MTLRQVQRRVKKGPLDIGAGGKLDISSGNDSGDVVASRRDDSSTTPKIFLYTKQY